MIWLCMPPLSPPKGWNKEGRATWCQQGAGWEWPVGHTPWQPVGYACRSTHAWTQQCEWNLVCWQLFNFWTLKQWPPTVFIISTYWIIVFVWGRLLLHVKVRNTILQLINMQMAKGLHYVIEILLKVLLFKGLEIIDRGEI